jgi:hypothetical protein
VEWVKLVKPAQWADITVQNPSEWALGERFDIDRKQVDQIVKAALLDRQTSIHIGFAQVQAGPCGKLPMEQRLVQPDRHARSGQSVEYVEPSAGIHDPKPAGGDNSPEQPRQQHRYET